MSEISPTIISIKTFPLEACSEWCSSGFGIKWWILFGAQFLWLETFLSYVFEHTEVLFNSFSVLNLLFQFSILNNSKQQQHQQSCLKVLEIRGNQIFTETWPVFKTERLNRRATRGEQGVRSLLPFFDNQKKCPEFGKKVPDSVLFWVKFSIQNVVLRESRRKYSKIFALFLLCF